jgi:hypothetical protein
MSEDIKVRKLPKTTIYIIVTLAILGILANLGISGIQQVKMSGVLKKLGYDNVSNITIYNKTPVSNEETKMQGELSKIKFKDLNTNQECFGFVLKNKKTGEFTKDLDCK